MTTSNVFIINDAADFEDQTNAVRGLLHLATNGVRQMEGSFTPAAADAIASINAAVIDWLDHNLADELRRRSKTPARPRPALVAAE